MILVVKTRRLIEQKQTFSCFASCAYSIKPELLVLVKARYVVAYNSDRYLLVFEQLAILCQK